MKGAYPSIRAAIFNGGKFPKKWNFYVVEHSDGGFSITSVKRVATRARGMKIVFTIKKGDVPLINFNPGVTSE